jgi:hypothetical protein
MTLNLRWMLNYPADVDPWRRTPSKATVLLIEPFPRLFDFF